MNDTYAKSIDFLLKNAGPVIQYRLRKEILQDLSGDEEKNCLRGSVSCPCSSSFQLTSSQTAT